MNIKRIIDVSRKIKIGMTVWPGDSGISIGRNSSIKEGDVCNVSFINMGLHSGTHIDAPMHYIDDSLDISRLDLSRYIGYASVFELDVKECITADHIRDLPLKENDIVFFKTRNSEIPESEEFQKDFVYLDKTAAELLLEKGVKTIGVDYLSIDSFYSTGFHSHYLLLSNNIGVIEGLNLKEVSAGKYFFSCLPLNIEGVDGSPARAVLLELE
ncbi:MAG: cyclase family protein [Bacillota bacterium]|nr:cyclase family protein [Bacillota bacterium]